MSTQDQSANPSQAPPLVGFETDFSEEVELEAQEEEKELKSCSAPEVLL